MGFRIERADRIGAQSFGRHDIRGPLRVAAANAEASQSWAKAINDVGKVYADFKEQEYDDQETEADLDAITGIGDLEADNAGKDEFDASSLDPDHPRYNPGTSGDAPTMVPGYEARPEAYRIGAKKIAEQASMRIQDDRRRKEFVARYLKIIDGNYVRKKVAGVKEGKAFHDRKLIAQVDQAESNDKYAVAKELIKGLPEDKRIEYNERNADRSADSIIAKARMAGDVPALKQKKAELIDKDYDGPLSAKTRRAKADAIQGDIDRIEDLDKEEKLAADTQAYTANIMQTHSSETAALKTARAKPLTKEWTSKHKDEAVRRIKVRFSEKDGLKEDGYKVSRERAFKQIMKGDFETFRSDKSLSFSDYKMLDEFARKQQAGIPIISNSTRYDEIDEMRLSPEGSQGRKDFMELDLRKELLTLSPTHRDFFAGKQSAMKTGADKQYEIPAGSLTLIDDWLKAKGLVWTGKDADEDDAAVRIHHRTTVTTLLDEASKQKGKKLTKSEADSIVNEYMSAQRKRAGGLPNRFSTEYPKLNKITGGVLGTTSGGETKTLQDYTVKEQQAAIAFIKADTNKQPTGANILMVLQTRGTNKYYKKWEEGLKK